MHPVHGTVLVFNSNSSCMESNDSILSPYCHEADSKLSKTSKERPFEPTVDGGSPNPRSPF